MSEAIMRNLILLFQLVILFCLLPSIVACGGSGSGGSNTPNLTTLVSMEFVDRPKPFRSDGQWQVVYELVINNEGETTVTLDSLTVSEDGMIVSQLQTADLRFRALNESIVVQPGELTALYLWIETALDKKPVSFENRLTFTTNQDNTAESLLMITLDDSEVTQLSAPLVSDGWFTQGIHNGSHHRRSFMMFDDMPRFSQRYAIDWVKVDDGGNWFSGDESINENHYAHGQDVIAPNDGEVVKVVNGYPDNIPGQLADGSTPLAGNYVVLKTQQDEYLMLAHLLVDSIVVKEGDMIEKGFTIAKIGNSGNSSAPHLHFQLTDMIDLDSPSSLNSIGQPFVIDSFNVMRGSANIGVREFELPSEGSVIGF